MAINYRVLPGCTPNVVCRYDDNGRVVPESAFDHLKLTAPLTDVIQPLARRHPDWRFETCSTSARTFTVYKGTEELGEILTTYRDYNTITKIRNAKIRAAISKGDGMASKDAAKVRKLVEKYFAPSTEDERINAKRDELQTQFNSLVFSAEHSARRKERLIAGRLIPTLIKEHRDTVLSVATSLSITGIEELEAAYDKEALFGVFNGVVGVVGVVRDGDKYWVAPKPLTNPAPMVSYTDETLPLQLRTNIGLLKLAQDGDAYDGVGVRCSPDLFLTVYNPEG
jgi:hypothetical protein